MKKLSSLITLLTFFCSCATTLLKVKSPSLEEVCSKVNESYKNKNWEECIEGLKKIVTEEETNLSAHQLLIKCYQKKSLDEGIEFYKKSLQDQEVPSGYFFYALAELFWKKDQLKLAKENYDLALRDERLSPTLRETIKRKISEYRQVQQRKRLVCSKVMMKYDLTTKEEVSKSGQVYLWQKYKTPLYTYSFEKEGKTYQIKVRRWEYIKRLSGKGRAAGAAGKPAYLEIGIEVEYEGQKKRKVWDSKTMSESQKVFLNTPIVFEEPVPLRIIFTHHPYAFQSARGKTTDIPSGYRLTIRRLDLGE